MAFRILSNLDVILILAYAGTFILSWFAQVPWSTVLGVSNVDPTMVAYVTNLVLSSVLGVGALVAVRSTLPKDFAFFRRYPTLALWIPLSVLVVIPLLAGVVTLWGWGSAPEESVNQQHIATILTSLPLVMVAPLLVVISPFVEEYFFRHLLIGKLSRYVNRWVCAALSVSVFAFAHLAGKEELISPALLPYLATSAALVLCYMASGNNLLASYLFHASKNALAIIVFSLS